MTTWSSPIKSTTSYSNPSKSSDTFTGQIKAGSTWTYGKSGYTYGIASTISGVVKYGQVGTTTTFTNQNKS